MPQARKDVIVFLIMLAAAFVLIYGTMKSNEWATAIGAFSGIFGFIFQFNTCKRLVRRVYTYMISLLRRMFSSILFWKAVSVLLVCTLFVSYLVWVILPHLGLFPAAFFCDSASVSPTFINVKNTQDGQHIGISDGNFIYNMYDTYQIYSQQYPDGLPANLLRQALDDKQAAASEYSQHDNRSALQNWSKAHQIVPNDAETLIYQENAQVLLDRVPYVDIVVGVTFRKTEAASSRDILQGAYIAQKTFNDAQRKQKFKPEVRLDIANSGNGHAKEVTCQIIHAAQVDGSAIVGIMGWTLSQDALDSIPLIDKAHLPMLAAAVSSNDLRNKSAYFARVNPPDQAQGDFGADYAVHKLHAGRAAVLRPSDSNPYSPSLAKSFSDEFKHVGGAIVFTKQYKSGDVQDISRQVQDALALSPDLIYYAGYASDANDIFSALPACKPDPDASIRCPLFLAGSALYRYGDYTNTSKFNSARIYFTAFAFPDEWKADPPLLVQQFFQDYSDSFGQDALTTGIKTYGYLRPEAEAMLAFDATSFLATACASISFPPMGSIAESLHQNLVSMQKKNFQGVTGQILIERDGNPQDKVVVVLHLGQDGLTHLVDCQGNLGPRLCIP